MAVIGLSPSTLCRAFVLAGLLGLAGCQSAEDLLGDVTGTSSEGPLPGKREPVLDPSETKSAADLLAKEPVAIPPETGNTNWSQTGAVASHAIGNLSLGLDLKPAFAIEAGVGSNSDGRLTAQPIVVGGRVYVLDSEATVRAFSAQNGAAVWSRSLVPEGLDGEGAFGGGLASDGSRVYATTAFGEVLAIDAGSGAIAWRQKVGSPVRGAPAYLDGRLYFVNVANDIIAVSTTDGSQIWKVQGTGERASIITSASPAVGQGLVMAPATTGDLIAVSAANGTQQWTNTLNSFSSSRGDTSLNDVAASPVISGNEVIAIGHSGRLAAFGLESGADQWSRDIAGTQMPWVAGDYLFVIANRRVMTAISRVTGKVRWLTDLPGDGNWSGPVVAGGRLVTVGSSGTIINVSPQTGQIMSKVSVGEAVYIAPVIAGGTLYLLDDDGTLHAYR